MENFFFEKSFKYSINLIKQKGCKMEKIKMTSSKNNRALVDECNLEKYLEMGYTEGWPEEAEETKETAEQLDEEKTNGDSINPEPESTEIIED